MIVPYPFFLTQWIKSSRRGLLGNSLIPRAKAELLSILVTSGYFAKVLFCIFTQSPTMAEDYGGELLSQQLLG